MELEQLFWEIDDFCPGFEEVFKSKLISEKPRKRLIKSHLSLSEVMTIVVYFHQSSYRTFKDFYQKNILKYHNQDFPSLVSYNRFVELMSDTLSKDSGNSDCEISRKIQVSGIDKSVKYDKVTKCAFLSHLL